jgi:hypothetical protein
MAMTVSCSPISPVSRLQDPVSLTPFPFRAHARGAGVRDPLQGRTMQPAPASASSSGLGVTVPAALAVVLLLVALVVAPERPQVQEAICQRHNGVEACRVW